MPAGLKLIDIKAGEIYQFISCLQFRLQLMDSSCLARLPAKIRTREINDADVPDVVNLLTRGYGTERTHDFWEHMLACLSRRAVPAGFPRYGYVIESDGKLVGVLIEIYSTIWEGGAAKIRCNGSSLYVDPAFRFYAQPLITKALKRKNVTVLNITSAPHTHRMIEALGFSRYTDGAFIAVPLLSRSPKDISVRIIDARNKPDVPFDSHERELLLDHADYGCTSLWCIARKQAHPFVFRSRPFMFRSRTIKILPVAQLVYCRNVDDFMQFARPIGWYLAKRVFPLVMLDANGPIRGLVGKYYADKAPRYYCGPDRPRIGDLAYTETSMFGI
jgi:hypothetical protein